MQQRDNSGRGNSPPDPYVMQAKIDMLFDALVEVKQVLKSIDETVAMIRVYDHQIKQQAENFSRLETDVREFRTRNEDLIRDLEKQIADVSARANQDNDDAVELIGTVKGSVENKVSYVQGAVAAVSVLGAILYAFSIWWGSRYIDMTDGHEKYIQTLQTLHAEDHLRESMARPKVPTYVTPRIPVEDISSSAANGSSEE